MGYDKDFQSVMGDLEGYLTIQQIDKMLACAESPRNRLMILIGFRTGRRISEILELKKGDIDFDKALIKFHILKKKDKNFLKLKAVDMELIEELKVYTNELGSEAWLFPNPDDVFRHLTRKTAYNIINKTARLAGIEFVGSKPVHPHVLRHSFSIHFLRNCQTPTIALKVLQSLLEHSSIAMTSTYLQFSQEDVRKELNSVFKKKQEDIKDEQPKQEQQDNPV